MDNSFREKYDGPTGIILDAWGQDKINKEIGDLYEESVFGKASIPLDELYSDFYGKSLGKDSYIDNINECVSEGKVEKFEPLFDAVEE